MSESEASVADYENQVASLKEEVNAANEKLATFKESLAAVAGVKEAQDVNVEEVVKATATRVASLEAQLQEVVAAALDKDAEDFAAGLVKEGKIASDAAEKFAGLYKKLGADDATDLAASLTPKTLGEKALDSEVIPEDAADAFASFEVAGWAALGHKEES